MVIVNFIKKLEICHFADTECQIKAVQHIINDHSKDGIPSIGLPPIETMKIKEILISANPKTSVNLEMMLKNMQMNGLGQAKILKIE